MITVETFSKKNCMQCDATTLTLDGMSVPYEVTKLDEDPEALELIKSLGFMQAPVVVVYNNGVVVDRWSGFRPDRLEALKNYFK